MRKLEAKDFIVLNNIIYRIHTTPGFNEMRYELLEQLKMIIDFDSAYYYMAAKDEGKLLGNQVSYNSDVDIVSIYENSDYNFDEVNSGKMLIYRETDLVSDEDRIEREYYKNVYKPNNWHYALHIVVAKDKKFLGLISLYRTIGKEDFDYDDIFVLDLLKDHLAFRMEKYLYDGELNAGKLTVTEVTAKYELTKRESTILRLLMRGMQNVEICDELVITQNTLKKHILNIYRKLDIRNRVQLFKMVRENE